MDIYINFNLCIGPNQQPDHGDEVRLSAAPHLSLHQVLEQQLQAVSVCRSTSTMNNYRTAMRSLFSYL